MRRLIATGIAGTLLVPLLASAAELPPASNFDAGKPLRAADLKALLQGLQDVATKLTAPGGWSIPGSFYIPQHLGLGTQDFNWTNNDKIPMKDTVRIHGDSVRIRSAGPGLYLEEVDQQKYREDYGYWRIIADANWLGFETWERKTPGELEFYQQDEFLSFHRAPTDNPEIGNHIIQWNYDFLAQGARDLKIGANWASPAKPQIPRMLSFTTLNGANNQLVEAMSIIPNGGGSIISIPNGPLKAKEICVGETCINEVKLKMILQLIGS